MIKRNKGLTDTGRPYEKCLRFGAPALTDAELLAVIIRSGVQGLDAVQLSEKVLRLRDREEGLAILMNSSIPELMKLPGIGEVKAIELCCIGEISKRIASSVAGKKLSAKDPESIADYFMERLRHDGQENVWCLLLDTRNNVIGEERLARGTVSASVISTRDIFLSALRFRAVNFVLIHNHPSGDPTPSEADYMLTEKARKAGELLDIHLLDHIIIGDRCYMSFLENHLLYGEAGLTDDV